MGKTLIAFTTFNHVEQTRECIEYLQAAYRHECPDILIVDDCSTDGTVDYIQPFNHITKDKRQGLTDSWNRAYKHFKNCHGYEYLLLCNNDILIPYGAIEGMQSKYTLTIPMTNKKGAGYARQDQYITNWLTRDMNVNHPVFTQRVQNTLNKDFVDIKGWVGFCMCFSREIIKYERPDGNLFDPKNINTGNDDDIARRVKTMLALGSFVWHHKGVSFGGATTDRNNLNRNYDV